MKKLNCWEIKNCGREPGGADTAGLGICPAATEHKADGIHGGKNAGRCCWVVMGTLCKGDVQGSYVDKFCTNCQECNVYSIIRKEEEPHFKIGLSILKEMKSRGAA